MVIREIKADKRLNRRGVKPSCRVIRVTFAVFSLSIAASKPVSPYSGYTGQVRSSVYQPTELALITKQLGNVSIKVLKTLIFEYKIKAEALQHTQAHTQADCFSCRQIIMKMRNLF